IVMSISDTVGENLDPNHEMVVVVFNGTPDELTYTVDDLAGMGLTLHPIQQESFDTVVQGASFDDATGTLTVPAWTTAVFVVAE
ncbi:MAG: alpha-1,6-glucosidase domain-containing protein, partial [Chloroflexota bacterium]